MGIYISYVYIDGGSGPLIVDWIVSERECKAEENVAELLDIYSKSLKEKVYPGVKCFRAQISGLNISWQEYHASYATPKTKRLSTEARTFAGSACRVIEIKDFLNRILLKNKVKS